VVGLVAKSEANYLHLPCLLNKSCTLCLLNEDIPLGMLHTTLRIRLEGSGPIGLQELGEVRHAQLLARARRRVLTYRGCASSCHPCQSGLRIRLLRLTLGLGGRTFLLRSFSRHGGEIEVLGEPLHCIRRDVLLLGVDPKEEVRMLRVQVCVLERNLGLKGAVLHLQLPERLGALVQSFP